MLLAALGGCWWPIEVAPGWMQTLALFLPTGWAMDALHKLVNFGGGPAAALPHVSAMFAGSGVLGWIGGIPSYRGRAWELHPLAVHPEFQGRGVGSALVHDFEELVRARGALTIHLGSDDVNKMTSLWGTDLYPNVLGKLAAIRNLHRHPYSFYEKIGYVIVGAIPDANGFGKPDILMAKRINKYP